MAALYFKINHKADHSMNWQIMMSHFPLIQADDLHVLLYFRFYTFGMVKYVKDMHSTFAPGRGVGSYVSLGN